MPEENKNSEGSWIAFIVASVVTLPFIILSFLWVVATSYNKPMLLAALTFWAVGGLLIIASAGLFGLIFIVIALIHKPKMFPVLILYAAIIIGYVLWCVHVFGVVSENL